MKRIICYLFGHHWAQFYLFTTPVGKSLCLRCGKIQPKIIEGENTEFNHYA